MRALEYEQLLGSIEAVWCGVQKMGECMAEITVGDFVETVGITTETSEVPGP